MQLARRATWPQFVAWALCGACTALMVIGAFALGPLALVPSGAFALVALLLGGANLSAIGAAAGPGAWGIVLGWLNRHGPGDVCTRTRIETSCEQQWSPWPFWAVGLTLVAAAVVLFAVLRHRTAHHA